MSEPTSERIATREQVVLKALAGWQPEPKWDKLEARAESLPAMLLRHGLLPVGYFLESKGKADSDPDRAVWTGLMRAIDAALPGFCQGKGREGLKRLASLPFEQYLVVNEVAVEAAALLARWVKVHRATDG